MLVILGENDLLKTDAMYPNRHFKLNIDEGLNLYVENTRLNLNNIKYALPLYIRDRDFLKSRYNSLNLLEINLNSEMEINGEKYSKLFFIEKEYAYKFLKKDNLTCLETLIQVGLLSNKVKAKEERISKQIFIAK